ncbi:MAG: hypothetical protein QNJ16_04880 [Rhodobacter sp.]|nr:hypothetical protein [Rhodobacter sp.]
MLQRLVTAAAAFALSSFGAAAQQSMAADEQSAPGLLVMSYNICWDCQSPPGATAVVGRGLSGKCYVTPEPRVDGQRSTLCAEHMGAAIDGFPALYGAANYDFVGLQEASNWEILQDWAKGTLGKLEGFGWKDNRNAQIATFYDPAKYDLVDTINGDLRWGRPMQISVFRVQADGSHIVFVNLHNCHRRDRCYFDYITERIGHHVNDHITKTGRTSLRGIFAEARVIMVGDFNEADFPYADEHGFMPGPITFDPLADVDAGQYGPITTQAKLAASPISCCATHIPWKCYGHSSQCRPGDYVFDSVRAVTSEVPRSYDVNLVQSDHLPVIGVLDPGGTQ